MQKITITAYIEDPKEADLAVQSFQLFMITEAINKQFVCIGDIDVLVEEGV
jgi:hypothetical protein